MPYKNVFKRYEIKYLITPRQKERLLQIANGRLCQDSFGKSTISNIYFDTPSRLLIRRSLEKPIYKEKLRLRSYGTADENSTVFAEIKKKYYSVVYKRRISAPLNEAMESLCGKGFSESGQISSEINYFLSLYKPLLPSVFISYDREAYVEKGVSDLRITFDNNIMFRDYDLSLCKGAYGTSLLEENQILMEIKTAGAIPLWLTSFLTEEKLYKTSFSKYGRAYETLCRNNNAERANYTHKEKIYA